MRNRWMVLSGCVAAQASFAALAQGLPVLGPQLRLAYGLGDMALAVVFASVTFGLVTTLYAWGWAADRFGERPVMVSGLTLAAVALLAARRADDMTHLVPALALAGVGGASVNASSGRAVRAWFPFERRGLAMGIRQTALPLGAAAASASLPVLGIGRGFTALALACLVGAAAAAVLVPAADQARPATVDALGAASRVAGDPSASTPRLLARRGHPPRRALALLSGASGLLIVGQYTAISFIVLILVDRRSMSTTAAAAVLTCVQLGGAAARVAAGVWADRTGKRTQPLTIVAVLSSMGFVLTALGLDAPLPLTVGVLIVTGTMALSWTGLAFTATAELADADRTGQALGTQSTVTYLGAALTPPAVAITTHLASQRVALVGVAAAMLGAAWLVAPLAQAERRGWASVPAGEGGDDAGTVVGRGRDRAGPGDLGAAGRYAAGPTGG